MVCGSRSQSPRRFGGVLLGLGGQRQASLVPSGRKTSLPWAAFVNAMAANALDLDDNLLYHTHIANTVVAAALGAAEHLDTSGHELITAVVGGYEVAARVSLSMPGVMTVKRTRGGDRLVWPNPYSHAFNTFGAAAAVGIILGLTETRMAQAFGLAGYSAPVSSMTKATANERFSLSKPGMYGWQALSGCMAALFAAQDIDCDDTVLDGEKGFWRMVGASHVDFGALTDQLGSRWWILDTSFKLEPAGTWMRPAVRALRQILRQSGCRPAEIEKIDVYLRPLSSSKLYRQREPKSYLDAQVSYEYLLGVTALGIEPEHWQDRGVFRSKALREMMQRIELHPSPEAEADLARELRTPPYRATGNLTTIRVRARGQVFSETARYGDGDPFDPSTRASDANLDEKFNRFAAPVLPNNGARAREAIWALEQAISVKQLVSAFCISRGSAS
jgi:2-methylcitrate dehydratase PrpD